MELLIESNHLSSIADEIKSKFSPVAKEKGLDFDILIGENLPEYIDIDRQKVIQILNNFLSNAFKFTKNGSVNLKINQAKLEKAVEGGKLGIAFAVEDTGIGIPAKKQEEIFVAFKQADGSTSREYGGTGLGLTISRQLGELMGGNIQVQSTENKGSTFILQLPLKMSSSDSNNNVEVPDDESEVVFDESASEQINWIEDDRQQLSETGYSLLIIDDDEKFSKILLKLARDHGFLGIATPTGKSGLELALKYQPSAILLDLSLPDVRGEQILKKLKETPETTHIPVHIVSAENLNLNLMKKGALGFLQKPAQKTDIENVFNNIERTLNRKIKKILVIEDDKSNQKAIEKLIDSENIHLNFAETEAVASQLIEGSKFDCVILDLNLSGASGLDILHNISAKGLQVPPVVVYTGKTLTDNEYNQIRAFTDSIVIKGADASSRLLDEISLFLHRVDKNLATKPNKPADKLLEGRKILLVDDDMRNLFALSKTLKKQGLVVEIAKDGQFALNVLEENDQIELVIMDIMMPVMDGYTAIERIMAQAKYRKLPIIALTAKAMPEDRQKCINVGASDYMSKPVDVDKLVSLMNVWLGED